MRNFRAIALILLVLGSATSFAGQTETQKKIYASDLTAQLGIVAAACGIGFIGAVPALFSKGFPIASAVVFDPDHDLQTGPKYTERQEASSFIGRAFVPFADVFVDIASIGYGSAKYGIDKISGDVSPERYVSQYLSLSKLFEGSKGFWVSDKDTVKRVFEECRGAKSDLDALVKQYEVQNPKLKSISKLGEKASVELSKVSEFGKKFYPVFSQMKTTLVDPIVTAVK